MLSILDQLKERLPKDFDLNEFENFLAIAEEYSTDSEFELDSGSAKEFALFIDAIKQRFKNDLKNFPEVEKRLESLSIRMYWMDSASLESNLKNELVSLRLVEALKSKVDVLGAVRKWIDFFEIGSNEDIQRRSDFIYLLSNNNEWIGTDKLQMDDGTLVPTVQNWLKDFLLSLPNSSQLPSSFDKVNYFTNSKNVKGLSTEEKEILTKIIDLYRFIKNPAEKINFSSTTLATSIPPAPRPPVSAPVFKAPTPPPAPKLEPVPQKPVSAFDKRLTQISAPSGHGLDLEALKHRMEEAEVKPVTPLTEIKAVAVPKAATNSSWSKELKREVTTAELPEHHEEKSPSLSRQAVTSLPEGENNLKTTLPKPIIPVAPNPTPTIAASPVIPKTPTPPTPVVAPRVVAPAKPAAPRKPISNFEASFSDIKNIDDLKKLSLTHLRRGPADTVAEQLKNKMITLARSNHVMPYYVLSAFEESPLFHSYLSHGNAMVAGSQSPEDLSREEFEAIADLRKEIQRL
ncbi:MAG: hypothetical protein KW802_03230 [Candidatus Doudnabacteria bacterium]|nr:hypothetical protein [Candidatus Doudnabacteria bacterium]